MLVMARWRGSGGVLRIFVPALPRDTVPDAADYMVDHAAFPGLIGTHRLGRSGRAGVLLVLRHHRTASSPDFEPREGPTKLA